MPLQSSVSGLHLKLTSIFALAQRTLPWPRHAEGNRGGRKLKSSGAEPAAQESGRETVFDPDFLKKLERLRLIAKRLSWAITAGEHASARKGFSLEFADYRRYQRGDDLRYVDWNVYRRLEKLLLKVFTAEEELNIYLLIDTSRSMAQGNPRKLDYAKKVAAALGYIGLKNLDRVGAAAFSTHLQPALALERGRKQVLKLFRYLDELPCDGGTQLRASVQSFGRLFPRSGLVIVISDLFDPEGWRNALEELASKKHQLLVIHIVDREEVEPAALGEVSLVDVESGRERKVCMDAQLMCHFQRELQSYFDDIEALCASRSIDYFRTTTDFRFDDFVLHTLRQASSVA